MGRYEQASLTRAGTRCRACGEAGPLQLPTIPQRDAHAIERRERLAPGRPPGRGAVVLHPRRGGHRDA